MKTPDDFPFQLEEIFAFIDKDKAKVDFAPELDAAMKRWHLAGYQFRISLQDSNNKAQYVHRVGAMLGVPVYNNYLK